MEHNFDPFSNHCSQCSRSRANSGCLCPGKPTCRDCRGSQVDWCHANARGQVTDSLCKTCCDARDIACRAKAKAMAEQPSDTIPAPSGWIPAVPCAPSDKPSDYVFRQGDFTGIDAEFPELDEPLAKLCADIVTAEAMLSDSEHTGAAAARIRMERADRKARPRATAESKMLAEGERVRDEGLSGCGGFRMNWFDADRAFRLAYFAVVAAICFAVAHWGPSCGH